MICVSDNKTDDLLLSISLVNSVCPFVRVSKSAAKLSNICGAKVATARADTVIATAGEIESAKRKGKSALKKKF